jgi:hypothetical protein
VDTGCADRHRPSSRVRRVPLGRVLSCVTVRLSTPRSCAAIAAIDLQQIGSVCRGRPCGEQTVVAPQAVARVLEACGQGPPPFLTTAAVTVSSAERARSTASHPSEVALQPDGVLMTKPARCKPARTGCRPVRWIGWAGLPAISELPNSQETRRTPVRCCEGQAFNPASAGGLHKSCERMLPA